MKPLPLFFILLFALTASSHAQASGRQEILVNGIAAIVNDETITTAQVNAAIATQFRMYLMANQAVGRVKQEAELKKLQAAALDDLINRKLIISEFKKQGGVIKTQYVDQAVDTFIRERFDGNDKKFYDELQKQGLTVKQFRDIQEEQIVIGALRQQNSGPKILVNTPQEREAHWNKIKEQFAEDPLLQLRMLSIPLQTNDGPTSEESQRKLTEEIRAKIVDGADFGTMAKTYSKDFFADQGGSAGKIDRDGLTRDITNVAFDLPVRQVSDIIVQGGYYRLLFVEAREGGKIPPYSTMEEQVDKLLLQEKRNEYMERWLSGLRKNADIRIFP